MGAEAKGMTKEEATISFAGWFALPYLGFEVICKLLQSYIGVSTGPISAHWTQGKDFIYVINTISAVAAMIGCCFIHPMENEPTEGSDTEASKTEESPPSTFEIIIKQATSATALFINDPKMPMMMGMNLAFGVSAAYMNSYTTGV